MRSLATQAAFLIICAMCLLPFSSPPLALGAGLLFALTLRHPFPTQSKQISGPLLRVCVVLLGFSMNLPQVLKAGADGMVFAAVTIATTLLLGYLVGRWLRIMRRTSALISAGTAICGGSAIAAVGSVLGAPEGEMSVALGTVFLLNAVALYAFPVIGRALHLTQQQFGTWAGVAIHDVSSVVGAASSYGLDALQTATAVKLSRTLWIIPLTLGATYLVRKYRTRQDGVTTPIKLPWFIGFFLLASMARSYSPWIASAAPAIAAAAKAGLCLTLFLIGSGLSKEGLQKVGWRPLLQGLILWLFISVSALAVILSL
jgi:uncharacterized integral membrane protein (TIGR00698 family)